MGRVENILKAETRENHLQIEDKNILHFFFFLLMRTRATRLTHARATSKCSGARIESEGRACHVSLLDEQNARFVCVIQRLLLLCFPLY